MYIVCHLKSFHAADKFRTEPVYTIYAQYKFMWIHNRKIVVRKAESVITNRVSVADPYFLPFKMTSYNNKVKDNKIK